MFEVEPLLPTTVPKKHTPSSHQIKLLVLFLALVLLIWLWLAGTFNGAWFFLPLLCGLYVFLFVLSSKRTTSVTVKFDTKKRWTEQQANEWYASQPWLVGSNYIPSTAVNQLEMWQRETFDPATIERELRIAQKLGMNTMRIFFHDLAYHTDSTGFFERVDVVLGICEKCGIKPLLVLFDSCWNPKPVAGPQLPPIYGWHNSRWVMAPGIDALLEPGQETRLEVYVRALAKQFKRDTRILAWDMWNEAENGMKENVLKVIEGLLPRMFEWMREEGVEQPLTTCLMGQPMKWNSFQMMQIGLSDILSFHNYGAPESFLEDVRGLRRFNRPILCTEWLARPTSVPHEILPIAKLERVGMFNWGFVTGKTNTRFPYDSIGNPYTHEPELWLHDLFLQDGSPYLQSEYDLFYKLLQS